MVPAGPCHLIWKTTGISHPVKGTAFHCGRKKMYLPPVWGHRKLSWLWGLHRPLQTGTKLPRKFFPAQWDTLFLKNTNFYGTYSRGSCGQEKQNPAVLWLGEPMPAASHSPSRRAGRSPGGHCVHSSGRNRDTRRAPGCTAALGSRGGQSRPKLHSGRRWS